MLKLVSLIIYCFLIFPTESSWGNQFDILNSPPHLEPVGVRFSQNQIDQIEANLKNSLQNLDPEASEIDSLLKLGKKASAWVNAINATRPKSDWLDLSSPKSSGGISYKSPLKNNTSLIKAKFDDYLIQTSSLISQVLKSAGTFPSIPPLSDEEFILSMRKLDRLYQATIRWAYAREWLSWYINQSLFDVRGYLILKDYKNLENSLKNFSTLSKDEQTLLTQALLDLCRNGDFDPSDCKTELSPYLRRNNLFGFYERFNKYGKAMYDLFFTIKKTRPEIFWSQGKTQLNSPFLTPKDLEVKAWLEDNVEEEWSKFGINFNIDFKDNSSEEFPQIQFKEGVTANVNGIAGNLITMEAEYPINTPDQMWTIRHEYGHVLGFQDCYIEFYDTKEKAMIYYEVDVENLMCSRNGRLQQTHVEQLLNKY